MEDIRRFVSNLLLENGMSEKDVARYMGNTPRTLLESYAEIREETELQMKNIIDSTFRDKNTKRFSIDVVAEVLNSHSQSTIIDPNIYELLDFITNDHVNSDNLPLALDTAKKVILKQNPNLSIFCNADYGIVKACIKTYKCFTAPDVELTQDINYDYDSIDIKTAI